MNQKSVNANRITDNSRDIIYKGAIIGGIIGALCGLLFSPSVLNIFGIYKANATYGVIAGVLLGGLIGVLISFWLKLYSPKNKAHKKNSYLNKVKIELREEELELYRHRVKTGEVKIHKEILKEEKNITVPVIREELVIEKRENDEKNEDNANVGVETIRIPIREERIEVSKYPVMLEDVSVFKQPIQEIQHIQETLKREKLHVKTKGKVNMRDKKIKK